MTKDTIAGLRAWMHEPDYIEDGFSLESVVAWINRRPIGAFEQMASELATLRESLAKAEEARSTWHRLAIDMSTERDDALARAAALQSKVEKLAGALEEMKPHVDKIERCIRINDEMGRVVIGQTESAAALAAIFAEALASLKETPQ